MVKLTSADPADLLLHKYQQQDKDTKQEPIAPNGRVRTHEELEEHFPHWALHANSTLLRDVAPSRRYPDRDSNPGLLMA